MPSSGFRSHVEHRDTQQYQPRRVNLVRRLLLLSGLILTGVLATASGAQAHDDAVECNGNATGLTIKGDLVVPWGASCQLIDSTVRGDIKVRGDGYFQATNTTVRGDVRGRKAQTIFLEHGSAVRGNVEADRVSQVFLFDSAVGDSIRISRADQKVNVCGMTVQEDIEVERSGRDILIGDPLAVDCGGNLVKRGNILVEDNVTDVELVVRGNTIKRGGDLQVKRNSGSSDKFIQDNLGGDVLSCRGNEAPFTVSGNTGWNKKFGQCAGP
jgi:hypothetical protein